MGEKWEYDYTTHVEELKSPYQTSLKQVEIVKKAMDARGRQGWELVAVSPVFFKGSCTNFKCFWKRRIEQH